MTRATARKLSGVTMDILHDEVGLELELELLELALSDGIGGALVRGLDCVRRTGWNKKHKNVNQAHYGELVFVSIG